MVKIPSPLTVAGPVGRPASACAISPTSSSFSRIDVPLGFFTQNAAAEASVQLMESLPPTMAGVTVGAATRRLSKIHPLSAAAKLREASKRLREMEMAMGKADEGYEFRPWIAMFDHLPRVVSKPRLARGPYTPAVRLSCQSQIMRPSLVLQVQEKIQKEIGALSTRVADDHPVDLGQIMRDLGDLERLDSLKGTAPKSGNGVKDAQRCLYPLFHHKVDNGDKVVVTFGELKETLPPVFSRAWNAIGDHLVNNKVSQLAALTEEDKAKVLFLRVHGVGPTFAAKFVEEGARTLDDLQLRKLSSAQRIGLRHVEDINRLIPRDEMDLIKAAIESAVQKAKGKSMSCDILGSYRRGVPYSSDIDLVIRHKSFDDADDNELAKELMTKVIGQLTADGLIVEENALSSGPKRYSGLIKLPDHPRYGRIDIRLAPYSSYDYMLLGGTGDALLMKLLRHRAKTLGFTLNEYGMGSKYAKEDQNPNGFRPGTAKIVKSEKEIFKILGLPYLKPEQRDYAIWKGIYLDAKVDLSNVEKL